MKTQITFEQFDRLVKERVRHGDESLQQALHWAIIALDTIASERMSNEFMRTLFAARCRDIIMDFLK